LVAAARHLFVFCPNPTATVNGHDADVFHHDVYHHDVYDDGRTMMTPMTNYDSVPAPFR
jgi:hypothetical protein